MTTCHDCAREVTETTETAYGDPVCADCLEEYYRCESCLDYFYDTDFAEQVLVTGVDKETGICQWCEQEESDG